MEQAKRAAAARAPAPVVEISEEQRAEGLSLGLDELQARTAMLADQLRVLKSEYGTYQHDEHTKRDKIKENVDKVKRNKEHPWLVATVIEILDAKDCMAEDEGGASTMDSDDPRSGKCAVVKLTTRQTIFLPRIGLVAAEALKPADMVGVNKDTYLILEKLPEEYDTRAKAMEIEDHSKLTATYKDIGGLEKQVTEMIQAIVMPIMHPQRFKAIGIEPPHGVLLYGEPGTGKTLLARICAAQTKATFLKLAGPQLVQMYIGDGAKIVRDAFGLAKIKAPAIIFIDELDAVGTRRFDSEKSGDREVQRTMQELLCQMDGFQTCNDVKVVAATNRIDVLDPALLRSGRFDRKIEFPKPDQLGREHILRIHSSGMKLAQDVSLDELARCTEDFNGAMLKAVCVEGGMIAMRENKDCISHEHFIAAISEVLAKKKGTVSYIT